MVANKVQGIWWPNSSLPKLTLEWGKKEKRAFGVLGEKLLLLANTLVYHKFIFIAPFHVWGEGGRIPICNLNLVLAVNFKKFLTAISFCYFTECSGSYPLCSYFFPTLVLIQRQVMRIMETGSWRPKSRNLEHLPFEKLVF